MSCEDRLKVIRDDNWTRDSVKYVRMQRMFLRTKSIYIMPSAEIVRALGVFELLGSGEIHNRAEHRVQLRVTRSPPQQNMPLTPWLDAGIIRGQWLVDIDMQGMSISFGSFSSLDSRESVTSID